MLKVIKTTKAENPSREISPSQGEQGGGSVDGQAAPSEVTTTDEQSTPPKMLTVTYVTTGGPTFHSDSTIEEWLSQNAATIGTNKSSREHLVAAALRFVEEHLQEKLGFEKGAEVRLTLDIHERSRRSMSVAPQAKSYSDFAAENMRFRDLWLEVRGTTFLILSLWDVPKSARCEGSWPPVISVCVDCPKDAWTVPSIGVYGVDRETQKAIQGFFDDHSLDTEYPVIQRKSKG